MSLRLFTSHTVKRSRDCLVIPSITANSDHARVLKALSLPPPPSVLHIQQPALLYTKHLLISSTSSTKSSLYHYSYILSRLCTITLATVNYIASVSGALPLASTIYRQSSSHFTGHAILPPHQGTQIILASSAIAVTLGRYVPWLTCGEPKLTD